MVLTNAQGIRDCFEWIAQAIIQELFDLKPKLDFLTVATESAKEHLRMYVFMMEEYVKHRIKNTT